MKSVSECPKLKSLKEESTFPGNKCLFDEKSGLNKTLHATADGHTLDDDLED